VSVQSADDCFEVRLLGPFEVGHNSVHLDAGSWPRSAQSLLKLLAMAPGHRRPRDELIDALWPDASLEAGASNLRWARHALRSGLGGGEPSTVLVEHGVVLLNPTYSWSVDLQQFELLSEASDDDVEQLEEALGLVRGEPLPEDRYEDWATPIRDRIERRWRERCLRVGAVHRARGAPWAALQWYGRLLDRHPLDEDAVQALLALYRELGQRVKGLAVYERFVERLRDDLGGEPAPETLALVERLRPNAKSPPHSLPAPLTSFVGREAELQRVGALLRRDDVRLLTLTGTGGAGKTRLALQVAGALLDDFPAGVFFVSLAPLSDPELVPFRIAQALGIREEPGQTITETMNGHLHDKRLLLVLDTFEHLLPAGMLVSDLLVACPDLTVLATSREPLRLYGEQRYVLSPLHLPEPETVTSAETLTRYDAVALFLQRAQAADVDFDLRDENASLVAATCHRLDGLPLAIELAAVRVGDRPLEVLLSELEHRLLLLTEGGRNLPPRQRSLWATLDWSHNLLTPPERTLFRRLGVFAAGCTVAAAEDVCTNDGLGLNTTSAGLTSLVDKSLLWTLESDHGETRYGMLETIREYAQERLAESEDANVVGRRHAEYFRDLAVKAEPALNGPEQGIWLQRLEREHDNLRAALRWSLDSGEVNLGLRLAGALHHFWRVRSHLTEGRRWLNEVLAQAGGDILTRALALQCAAVLARLQGDDEQAVALSEDALALRRQSGDKKSIANSLGNLGILAELRGEYERTRALYEEALSLRREVGDRWGMANSLQDLAIVAHLQHDDGRAGALHEESLARYRELGDTLGIAIALLNLGELEQDRGDYTKAMALHRESLVVRHELGDTPGTAGPLEGIAAAAGSQGEGEQAAHLWGAATALRDLVGAPLPTNLRCRYEQQATAARAKLGDARWNVAWEKGRAMSLEQAVAYALEVVSLARTI